MGNALKSSATECNLDHWNHAHAEMGHNLPDQTPAFGIADEQLRVLHANWAYTVRTVLVVLVHAWAYAIGHLRRRAAYPPMTVCLTARWWAPIVVPDFVLGIKCVGQVVQRKCIRPTIHRPKPNSVVSPSKFPDFGNIEWLLPESCVLIDLVPQRVLIQSRISANKGAITKCSIQRQSTIHNQTTSQQLRVFKCASLILPLKRNYCSPANCQA